jgi:hypothetical protein
MPTRLIVIALLTLSTNLLSACAGMDANSGSAQPSHTEMYGTLSTGVEINR